MRGKPLAFSKPGKKLLAVVDFPTESRRSSRIFSAYHHFNSLALAIAPARMKGKQRTQRHDGQQDLRYIRLSSSQVAHVLPQRPGCLGARRRPPHQIPSADPCQTLPQLWTVAPADSATQWLYPSPSEQPCTREAPAAPSGDSRPDFIIVFSPRSRSMPSGRAPPEVGPARINEAGGE